MSLELAHERLGWPSRDEILNPSGAGARVFAQLAQGKIGSSIQRHDDGRGAQVGVLSPNPRSSDTEPPLAVVCDFPNPISDTTLRDIHRLAWNFSRCPMVVTVEPHLLRAWTCCEPPAGQLPLAVHDLPSPQLHRPDCLSQRVAQALHWVNLISGQFFKEHADRFRRDQRADHLLLENLRFVRSKLREVGLKDDVCHDLLARVIFIQFLFDRRDSSGKAALNAGKLEQLHNEGKLRAKHKNFASILDDYEETYRLFGWLNERFNGDLFPGTGDSAEERERAWQGEKSHVKPRHLDVLAQFVGGKLDMPKGQFCLWREYAFDAIPLEFISSIYEAFVTERARSEGIYYTPPHLVDFMLDRVLPWDGEGWDLKVLDPACGSGVFLVKAFQRLIHRWKKAHLGEDIRADALRRLLEKNLFGVDKDPHAVRVASFSLYLAMCDEIDPKYYWTQVRFPAMRGRQLINADFFEEKVPGFRTGVDRGSYDVVVGNPPWGRNALTEAARCWAHEHGWRVAERCIGTLFLPKAAALTGPRGHVSMLQPARVLLFNQRGPAQAFRKRLFAAFKVREVVNFSALTSGLFKGAWDPVCVVVLCAQPPAGEDIVYLCPKRGHGDDAHRSLVVEPGDVHLVHPDDAAADPVVWSAYVWGTNRDLAFARRLSNLPNLERLEKRGIANIRRGISRGDRKKRRPEIVGKPMLDAGGFPDGTSFTLPAKDLPINRDPMVHSRDSTDFSAFALPQMLVKQSWLKDHFRFQAALVSSDPKTGPVFCSRSYASVHVPDEKRCLLEAACVALKSELAVYFLLLASGRFASYRGEPNLEDLLRVPIPEGASFSLASITDSDAIDAHVRRAFGFKDAEWVLIEDLFNVTLPDFKGDECSPGRQRTHRRSGGHDEPELSRYCEYFIRVLKAGFGEDKAIAATVFQEKGTDLLPFRLVAFELGQPAEQALHVETLDLPELVAELEMLNNTWLKTRRGEAGSVYHQRVARIYTHRGQVPTVFVIKPDACRYWTRSMGLHDADEVAADLVRWQWSSAGSSESGRSPA